MKKIKKLSVWFLASLMLIFLWNFPAFSKEKSLFTIDDYFQVRSMRVADMSEDGTWLACTLRTRADRLPRNNYRYGDPTYVAPFQMKVVVINTQTGKSQEVFNRKKQVRGLTWSPDGKMLAFFQMKKEGYHLTIWNRETNKFENIEISHRIASDSYLDWSPDGESLYFSYSVSDKYDRGLKKLNLENLRMTDLIRSDHRYRRWEMSENGNVFVYTDSDGDYPADWYSADKEFSRIQTPLLCITGDQDPNVEELQSQEIYYALRRLGKKVVWLRYHNGAHGGPQTNEERKHMYKKMLDWYDTYLKKDPTS